MPCRFEDHPTVPVTSVHSLVAIARNGWSRSIGTPGRNQLEQVVAITRCAQLEHEIAGFRLNGEMVLIPDYVQLLDALENAASSAAKLPKTKKGPKWGAFDRFIEALLMAALQRRGHWTNSNLAGNWSGSLLKALEILRPYLPNDFFPVAVLGRSVERVRENFKDYLTEKRTSPV